MEMDREMDLIDYLLAQQDAGSQGPPVDYAGDALRGLEPPLMMAPAEADDGSSNRRKQSEDVESDSPSAKRSRFNSRKTVKPKVDLDEEEDSDDDKLPATPSTLPRQRGSGKTKKVEFQDFFQNACIPAALLARNQAVDDEAKKLEEVNKKYIKQMKNYDKNAMTFLVTSIIYSKEQRIAQLKNVQMVAELKEEVAEKDNKNKEIELEKDNCVQIIENQKKAAIEAKNIINSLPLFN